MPKLPSWLPILRQVSRQKNRCRPPSTVCRTALLPQRRS
jgi:hypothetical protein